MRLKLSVSPRTFIQLLTIYSDFRIRVTDPISYAYSIFLF